MKFFVVLALLAVSCSARVMVKRANGDQQPKIWDALKQLNGGKDITTEDLQNLLNNAVAGTDYPVNAQIPDKQVDCKSYKQAGFYADDDSTSRCQVFHRCDDNGNVFSFLCPNKTLFNQITLICDWFVNVDCAQSKNFVDYSNSRLADQNAHLLDDQDEIAAVAAGTGAVGGVKAKPKPVPKTPAGARAPKSDEEAPNANEGATAAPAAEETTPASADETTVGDVTSAAPSEETTAPAAIEEATEAPAQEKSAEAGGETTPAAADETSAAAGDQATSPAAPEDTPAASQDTTAAQEDATTEATTAAA